MYNHKRLKSYIMNNFDRQQLIAILSSFETRSNKDIQTLMRIAFEQGKDNAFTSFDAFMIWIKRELLEL
jgi:hypothetical protein